MPGEVVRKNFWIILLIMAGASMGGQSWFGGGEALGPQDTLRHQFAPYDLIELNYLGTNYCENLLDKRVNLTSYTHLSFDSNARDAWHMQFPDDTARFVEGLVFEDRYGPVVRLELVRRLMKGIMSARYPGTKAYYSFRHRNDGKTFIILEDRNKSGQGGLMLSMLGDALEGFVKLGFRVNIGGAWHDAPEFSYEDELKEAGTVKVARYPEAGGSGSKYWNESPYVFKRTYRLKANKVNFVGKYWFSNENKPLEFGFSTKDAEVLDIVIGEPNEPMPLLGNKNAEGIIHLPDRETTFNSKQTGNKTFERPEFNYFILRKQTAWACPGYSTALLVIWEGKPEKVEARAENGYGQIRISYRAKAGEVKAKVWLYPFQWVNHKDMGYIYSNAECFLAEGKLMHNGFPSQQLVNCVPAGLAAGAYLLSKYDDPLGVTARIQAEEAVDAMILPEQWGMKFVRVFNEVRAAAWMIKTGKLLKDNRLVNKYTPLLEMVIRRMLSGESGYDGQGWQDGWSHFYATRAAWMAYDATGKPSYLEAYERAMKVYTIDAKGIYRYGVTLAASGGFDTYAGSLPLGAWGHAGRLGDVELLINLDVPNGWHHPTIPVKDLWNDTGAGPWAQDDANPEYVGYCLGGCKIPQDKKYVLPLGSFPIYDGQGNVEITGKPIVDNPYFPKAGDKLRILSKGENVEHEKSCVTFVPGEKAEAEYMVESGGKIHNRKRIFKGNDEPVIYKFDVEGARGAAVDLEMEGDSYTVEVSPDGKRWYKRLNTWSEIPTRHSLDVSFLTGCADELLKMAVITPPDDEHLIVQQSNIHIERGHCRYADENGYIVYKLNLPQVSECHLEFVIGNGYRVQFSPDNKLWHKGIDVSEVELHRNQMVADAAWLRIVDITPYLNNSGNIYIKVSNSPEIESLMGRGAFLRRLTVYCIIDCDNIYVRIANAKYGRSKGFTLKKFIFRKWGR